MKKAETKHDYTFKDFLNIFLSRHSKAMEGMSFEKQQEYFYYVIDSMIKSEGYESIQVKSKPF